MIELLLDHLVLVDVFCSIFDYITTFERPATTFMLVTWSTVHLVLTAPGQHEYVLFGTWNVTLRIPAH